MMFSLLSLLGVPLSKVLIHADYGSYGMFSDEFHRKFQEKYQMDFDEVPHYYSNLDKTHLNKHIESRYDPRTIDIFEQLGAERSRKKTRYSEESGHVYGLSVVKVPTALLDVMYISEYNGLEWIWCNTSQKYKQILMATLGSYDVLKNTQQEVRTVQRFKHNQ